MAVYAKIDDVTNLSPLELIEEIYGEDPEIIFEVIRRNRLAPPATQTKTEAVAAVVTQRKLEADDLVDGFLAAETERGAERATTLRELATSVFEAAGDIEQGHERAATLAHLAELVRKFPEH